MPKNAYKGNLVKITTIVTKEQLEIIKDYAKKNFCSQADIIRRALNDFIRKTLTQKESELKDEDPLVRRRAAEALDSGLTSDVVWALSKQMADQRTQMPEEELLEADEKEKVSKLLGGIGKRGATVLRMRFGLDDGEPMTLKQVGEKLNISRERVRQIEEEALKKLSYKMAHKGE